MPSDSLGGLWAYAHSITVVTVQYIIEDLSPPPQLLLRDLHVLHPVCEHDERANFNTS